MNRAGDRLVGSSWTDPQLTYAAVGETLWWISTLDDLLEGLVPARAWGFKSHSDTIDGFQDIPDRCLQTRWTP